MNVAASTRALAARRGPLASSYPAAVVLVILSLGPFLLLTGAVPPMEQVLAAGVGLSPHALDVTIALSDAAYAFGTVLAVQLAVHLPARRMLVVYLTAFVAASALSAWAPTPDALAAGFVAQGLCTSLLLIAAVPPLVTGWPATKMPVTGAVMNLCIFGAVAAGPTVGSLQAAAGGWRPLFCGVAAVAAVALATSLLTFEDDPPADTGAPWDLVAMVLGGAGCAAAFFGAAALEATGSAGALALAPLLAGTAAVAALVVHEHRTARPLMPVKQLETTLPVGGIVVAMFASSAAFGLTELLLAALRNANSLTAVAVAFLPELGAAVLTAVLFGLLFRTRFTPLLAFGGMVVLTAAAAVTAAVGGPGDSVLGALSSGLIGLGVGASVSPALFIAGFSLRSGEVQRVFALVELLRGVTAFLVAPILLFLVPVLARVRSAGLQRGAWICLAIAAVGGVLGAALFLAGGARLQVPDLERWQEQGEAAWRSPPLLDRLRPGPPVDRPHGGVDDDRVT